MQYYYVKKDYYIIMKQMAGLLADIKIRGIRQFQDFKYSADTKRITLEKANETFAIIYNCGGMQSFMINGILYNLKTNEVLTITPFAKCGEVELDKRASFYWLEFELTEGFLGLNKEQTDELIRDFNNYVLTKLKGGIRLRQLFRNLFIRDESYKVLGKAYVESILILIIAELLQNGMFQNQKGADWGACNADALQVYIENNGPGLALTIRFDYYNRMGDMEMIGPKHMLLEQQDGSFFYTKHPCGAYTHLIPQGFKGFAIVPMKKEFIWLNNYPISMKMEKDFYSMNRLLYYFYGYTVDRKKRPLAGGENFSIGALSLINYEIVNDGKTEFIKKELVKSLSYAKDKNPEQCYLIQEHMATIFNKQYYEDAGMKVSFSDGLLRCRQVSEGYPFVCSNMGCDALNIVDYSQDIRRVIDYIKEHPGEKHSIEELSKIAYLSESRLKQKFKDTVGQTPLKFAEEYRIKIACKQLLSDKSLIQIAYDMGYSSAPHFSYAFKKATGLTPSQYRKLNVIK